MILRTAENLIKILTIKIRGFNSISQLIFIDQNICCPYYFWNVLVTIWSCFVTVDFSIKMELYVSIFSEMTGKMIIWRGISDNKKNKCYFLKGGENFTIYFWIIRVFCFYIWEARWERVVQDWKRRWCRVEKSFRVYVLIAFRWIWIYKQQME